MDATDELWSLQLLWSNSVTEYEMMQFYYLVSWMMASLPQRVKKIFCNFYSHFLRPQHQKIQISREINCIKCFPHLFLITLKAKMLASYKVYLPAIWSSYSSPSKIAALLSHKLNARCTVILISCSLHKLSLSNSCFAPLDIVARVARVDWFVNRDLTRGEDL